MCTGMRRTHTQRLSHSHTHEQQKMMFQQRFINKMSIQMRSPSACSFIYHRQLHRAPSSLSNTAETPAKPPPFLPHVHTQRLLFLPVSNIPHTHTHTPTLSDGSFLPIQQNSLDAVVMSLPWTKEIRWPYWDPIDMHTLSYTHTIHLSVSVNVF